MPVNWWPDEMSTDLDADLKRLAVLVDVFQQMDLSERGRALDYLNDRFAEVSE